MKRIIIALLILSSLLMINSCGEISYSDEFIDKFGKTYYYDLAGNMVKNDFVKKDNSIYHFDDNGSMTKGWLIINHQTYYFDDNGKMVTGKKTINGNTHFFDIDGRIKEGWVRDGDKYYFCKENGSIITNTWIDINDNITKNVTEGIYFLDEKGEMAADCCREYNGSLYAFDSYGKRLRGVRVANILFNDGYGVNNETSLKRSETVRCHFHVTSDGEKKVENLSYKVIYPNGQTTIEKWDSVETDSAYSIGWDNGIGNFPVGTLRIQFFDSKNKLIGEGSVYITA